MHLQETIYLKFLNGDHLTNYEVEAAKLQHQHLANELGKLGAAFRFSARECLRVAEEMVRIQEVRAIVKAQDDTQTEAYKEGYQVGLSWDADWTPGGPSIFACARDAKPEYQQKAKESAEYYRLWMWGWKAGMKIDPNKMITKFLKWNGKPIPPVRCVELFPWVV